MALGKWLLRKLRDQGWITEEAIKETEKKDAISNRDGMAMEERVAAEPGNGSGASGDLQGHRK